MSLSSLLIKSFPIVTHLHHPSPSFDLSWGTNCHTMSLPSIISIWFVLMCQLSHYVLTVPHLHLIHPEVPIVTHCLHHPSSPFGCHTTSSPSLISIWFILSSPSLTSIWFVLSSPSLTSIWFIQSCWQAVKMQELTSLYLQHHPQH